MSDYSKYLLSILPVKEDIAGPPWRTNRISQALCSAFPGQFHLNYIFELFTDYAHHFAFWGDNIYVDETAFDLRSGNKIQILDKFFQHWFKIQTLDRLGLLKRFGGPKGEIAYAVTMYELYTRLGIKGI